MKNAVIIVLFAVGFGATFYSLQYFQLHPEHRETENTSSQHEKQSTPEESYRMGMAYLNGDGVAVDHQLALKHMKASADERYPPACLFLGKYYQKVADAEGKKQAFRYLTMAASSTHEKVAQEAEAFLEIQILEEEGVDVSSVMMPTNIDQGSGRPNQ